MILIKPVRNILSCFGDPVSEFPLTYRCELIDENSGHSGSGILLVYYPGYTDRGCADLALPRHILFRPRQYTFCWHIFVHVIIVHIDFEISSPSAIQMALFWSLKILPDVIINQLRLTVIPHPFFPLSATTPLHAFLSLRLSWQQDSIHGITFSWGSIASALVVNDSFSRTSESEAGGTLRQGWWQVQRSWYYGTLGSQAFDLALYLKKGSRVTFMAHATLRTPIMMYV